jgi:hypothetical protein
MDEDEVHDLFMSNEAIFIIHIVKKKKKKKTVFAKKKPKPREKFGG